MTNEATTIETLQQIANNALDPELTARQKEELFLFRNYGWGIDGPWATKPYDYDNDPDYQRLKAKYEGCPYQFTAEEDSQLSDKYLP